VTDTINAYGEAASGAPTTGASTTVSSFAYAGNTALKLPRTQRMPSPSQLKNDSVDGTTLVVWPWDNLTQIDNLAVGSPNTQAAGVTKTYTYKLSTNTWTTS
jgi:hypothetical protein